MSQVALRLRTAREKAGFENATEAAKRFDWRPPTYLAHENGSRGVNVETAKEYARAFRVSADWLLFGTESEQRSPAPTTPSAAAFAEDAVPYEHVSSPKNQMKGLYPSAKMPEIAFRAARHMPDLAVCAGDMIVCDLSATGASGQIVIVQHLDPETGEAVGHTLRRYLPPLLIASENGLTMDAIKDDDPSVIIRFPVVGIIRQS